MTFEIPVRQQVEITGRRQLRMQVWNQRKGQAGGVTEDVICIQRVLNSWE